MQNQTTNARFRKLYRSGQQLAKRGRLLEAIEAFEAALTFRPMDPSTLFALGNVAKQGDQHELALRMFEVVIKIQPGNIEAHNNLATSLTQLGRFQDAIDELVRAIEIDDQAPELWTNLGNAHARFSQGHEALDAFNKALALRPNHTAAHSGMGDVLNAIGEAGRAVEYYTQALKVAKKSDEKAQIRFNRSLALLCNGNLVEGWDEYETRFAPSLRKVKYTHGFRQVRNRSLTGKRVLVTPDQGLGDEIEMASVLPDLMAVAEKVHIAVDPRLCDIYRRSFPDLVVHKFRLDYEGSTRIVQIDDLAKSKEIDFAIPSTSLPRLFRRDISDFPHLGAYLKPDPNKTAAWRARLDEACGTGKRLSKTYSLMPVR